jgi:uncharacterized repeat protein (TIGR03803 family)
MKITIVTNALSIGVVVALLAGCGGSQPPIAPGAFADVQTHAPQTSDSSYTIVFSFDKPTGRHPKAGLIAFKGSFYGTASGGGLGKVALEKYGKGTVFVLTPGGQYHVLHAFRGGPDGFMPTEALTVLNGVLYGTTEFGGSPSCSCGTIFSLSPDGSNYKVVYTFTGTRDWSGATSNLLPLDGTLYGTTGWITYGPCKTSNANCGTVFAWNPSSGFKSLHVFSGDADGAAPSGTLVAMGGIIYGTTRSGGANGTGTVYSITTAGAENVIYSFKGGKDCALPEAGVTFIKGTMYGTAANACSESSGVGGVFKVTTRGKESVLYGFDKKDGANPEAPLVAHDRILYGTTYGGGAYNNGTAFSLTTGGTLQTLHAFGEFHDGKHPTGKMIYYTGLLYGTLPDNGEHDGGLVFSLTP